MRAASQRAGRAPPLAAAQSHTGSGRFIRKASLPRNFSLDQSGRPLASTLSLQPAMSAPAAKYRPGFAPAAPVATESEQPGRRAGGAAAAAPVATEDGQ